MNRRNFFKSLGAIGALASIGIFSVQNKIYGDVGLGIKNPRYQLDISGNLDLELEDLYSFLESKTISNIRVDNNHLIPFKLYPYQKEILKDIHENDRLIIVKCRQLGMTTLLAGYAAWLNTKKKDVYNLYCNHRCSPREYNECYDGILERFGSDIRSKHMLMYPKAAMSNHSVRGYYLTYFDEANYDTETYHGIYAFEEMKTIMKEWHNGSEINEPHQGKIVIAGSIDANGLLERATKDKDFKVVTYPIDETLEAFQNRDFYSEKNKWWLHRNQFEREFECKFV